MKKTIAIITSDPDSVNYEIIKKSLFFFKNKKKEYLEKSFQEFENLYKLKKVHALINMPLNKGDFFNNSFPGVTEYLAKKFKCSGKETMLLYNHNFSVSPLTTHIKIKNISKNINVPRVNNNFKNILNFYKKFIKIKKPLIGILGLNPHNAIDTFLDSEEQKIIIPTINNLKKKI